MARVFAGLLLLYPLFSMGQVSTSRHNLSASGPGTIKTADTTEVCIFCHTPHAASPMTPLWNREAGPQMYTTYDSTTLMSSPGQPDGNTKLCLTCHDGTVAVGQIVNPDVTFTMAGLPGGTLETGSSGLGEDLSDDHPVSFVPVSGAERQDPPPGDPVHYDDGGKLQCTSCHDPHREGTGNFLVKTDLSGQLCLTCHDPQDFGLSAHATSTETWNSMGTDPWPGTDYTTVSENACAGCHRPHDGEGGTRLLVRYPEEAVCDPCHNGNVASDNVMQEFLKPSAHLVQTYTDIHDPTESPVTMARHVECADCHNPHQVNDTTATTPAVDGDLNGVPGVDISGAPVDPAIYQYQVCIRCHGDNAAFYVIPSTDRQLDTSNIRLAIQPTNPSYHAIAAQGTAASVPSLRSGYTPGSMIYCTDCHNSDTSVNAGGTGPNGPHGSAYAFLLERRYDTADYTPYSESAYALCLKCHDPAILLSGTSTFPMHRRHVIREDVPCSTCHDPHGVPQGVTEDGDHVGLINFDRNLVQPDLSGRLRYEVVSGRAYCYMQCHGNVHSPAQFAH